MKCEIIFERRLSRGGDEKSFPQMWQDLAIKRFWGFSTALPWLGGVRVSTRLLSLALPAKALGNFPQLHLCRTNTDITFRHAPKPGSESVLFSTVFPRLSGFAGKKQKEAAHETETYNQSGNGRAPRRLSGARFRPGGACAGTKRTRQRRLCVDGREFGKSGGEPGRVLLREQIRDIENAGIYLSLQDEAEGKDIVLAGWGMGAGLLLEAADEVPRQAGLVSINGFCNGRRLFSPPLKNGPTPRPVPPQFLFRFAGCGSSFP